MTKHFGGLAALDGLDLHVDEGEIVSAIGPNGAGKSTLFNVITGLYAPDAGDIKLRGRQHRGSRAASDHQDWASGAPSRTCTCSRT